jgi:hypothetical protein
MAAGVTLFEVQLPTIGKLTARRLFNDQEGFPYELEPGDGWSEFWSMGVHDAVRLGHAAAQRGDAVKAGPVFARKVGDTEELIIEIGIVDDAVCLQMFALPQAMLRDKHAELLLTALHHLGVDASGIRGVGNAWGLAQ